jgi:DNA-binding GntR family transcriptional regulator
MRKALDAPGEIAKIENHPLRVQVADVLRRAIVNGQMKPGTPVIEMAIAEQLNVSRAPVREAIQVLENDGLIETVAYKGKRVKPLTARDIEELYSLREQLEVFAIRRIIDAGADVSELRRHCADMTSAADKDDFEGLMSADKAFHRALIALADHGLLLAQWDNLFLRIQQIMALRNSANRDIRAVARNHPPIVAAIEAKDLARATALMEQHTRSASDLNLHLSALDQ